MYPCRSRYLRGRLRQLVGTLMLLKGILRRHVKPVTEEGFLTSQLPRRLIWSSFLGDDGSQDGRHPSWVFDMKMGKQTIKGKNLGGRQGVAWSPSGCSLGIGLSQEVRGLYIFSAKTLSVQHHLFHYTQWLSVCPPEPLHLRNLLHFPWASFSFQHLCTVYCINCLAVSCILSPG